MPSAKIWRTPLLVLAVVALLAYGLQQRLHDPLSTPVIPAEDPYTHMALVREHLHDGNIDPLVVGTGLYPPGMHAFLAAIMAFTGVSLYDLARVGPAAFGVLGLAGIAVLMARHESATAAVAGVLAAAIAPEIIFRTTMLSPTAVDVALLPFLALCILETLQGRLAWAAPTTAIALFLLLSHPWLFGIVGVAGLGLVLLCTVLPWSPARGPLMTAWGLVAVVAIVGVGIALSLTGCWGTCGPGFRDVVGPSAVPVLDKIAIGVFVLALIPLAVKALRRGSFEALLPATRPAPGLGVRMVVAQLMLIGAIVLAFVAQSKGMPPYVDLPRMMGWPLLILGALGLAAVPFRPSPAGHLGAALALATYPFVLFNPFHSQFWSHRTAVYFGIGLCLLVGVAAAALVQAGLALARRLPTAPAAGAGASSNGAPAGLTEAPHRVAPIVAVTGLLLLVGLGGTVVAAEPGQYEGGWYRLYQRCEFDGLQQVASQAQGQPQLLVITGTWESKLIVSAFADDTSRLWYKPDFFTDPQERAHITDMLQHDGRPVLVLVDARLATEHPDIDPSFLHKSPWVAAGSWCAPGGNKTAPHLDAFSLAGQP